MLSRSRNRRFDAIAGLSILLSTILASPPSRAEPVEEFYRGKRINLIIGYGPGGGYDVFARLLARHLGRHIAGSPQILVQTGKMLSVQHVIASHHSKSRY